ncbi:peptidoglycan DD-metalloendopeptidase family protein [Flaviaesturariibacter aridisoli]|uniref:M23 family metallopeptidase n=1 Tax=Flaviaesturariibacter aridisoli TaxID=2545761 RepID=A0A4R4E3W0_9BACT|nr:peptidoglycan DD-metalloendopeptidase family protein [Flaviaesturariibacter aridisoli]TCZ71028.1 M23 family metallopeptidase [Flaviaesturariibacter aridisoli]
MKRRTLPALLLAAALPAAAQQYPQNYFRNPLDIPLQLVANFGEIRANHWHMGLDIRTQQRVNLPVYAAADGYVARVGIEPGGFGQAIYIAHPNGYTTLYAHLNAFFPELAAWVKSQQYARESWAGDFVPEPNQFPVHKGQYLALSGSTGASQGPHVHFEIRDSKTENCLNPLLFGMPIADAVPPSINRIALYDRTRSTWAQTPQYVSAGTLIRVGSRRVSFAIGTTDRFSGSNNPNGTYSARLLADGSKVSEFVLDNISYNDTRLINAQLDYRYHSAGGPDLQHLTPLPGATSVGYHVYNGDGTVHLDDEAVHEVLIEAEDAAGNVTRRGLRLQYDPALARSNEAADGERFLPNNVNIFERPDFELYTTDRTVYDTVAVAFGSSDAFTAGAASPLYSFLPKGVPAHDSVTVRIRPAATMDAARSARAVIRNKVGTRTFVQRARWNAGWAMARFRQFGTYQLLVDSEPPTVNTPPANLRGRGSLLFVPHDNLDVIRSFRLEVDSQWLRCSNDKGKSWLYTFDEHFPEGTHELKVTVEDEAGNVTVKTWTVTR